MPVACPMTVRCSSASSRSVIRWVGSEPPTASPDDAADVWAVRSWVATISSSFAKMSFFSTRGFYRPDGLRRNAPPSPLRLLARVVEEPCAAAVLIGSETRPQVAVDARQQPGDLHLRDPDVVG